jgi:hypothetical protein
MKFLKTITNYFINLPPRYPIITILVIYYMAFKLVYDPFVFVGVLIMIFANDLDRKWLRKENKSTNIFLKNSDVDIKELLDIIEKEKK